MEISKLIKENKELETYGMPTETIIDLIGFDKIAKDQVEDLQHYIDNAHFEMQAILAECKAEFGI